MESSRVPTGTRLFVFCMGCARVAELVDALDLGSSGLELWGFESPLSHFELLVEFQVIED